MNGLALTNESSTIPTLVCVRDGAGLEDRLEVCREMARTIDLAFGDAAAPLPGGAWFLAQALRSAAAGAAGRLSDLGSGESAAAILALCGTLMDRISDDESPADGPEAATLAGLIAMHSEVCQREWEAALRRPPFANISMRTRRPIARPA